MSTQINRSICFLLLLCLLSCDNTPPIDEEVLVAQLLHVDSTLNQAPKNLQPEITMPLPASTEDTIIVHLEQKKGWGPFEGALGLRGAFLVKNRREFDPRSINRSENDPWKETYEAVRGIPDTLSDMRIVQLGMQMEQAVNHAYKAGLMDEAFALLWFRDGAPGYLTDEFVDQRVSILIGEYNGHPVVVYDTDNDESFEGEQAVVYPKMPSDYSLWSAEGWNALPNIQVAYEYFDGSFIQEGTTYLKVNPYFDIASNGGLSERASLLKRVNDVLQETITSYSARDVSVGPSQHQEGEFAVGGHTYRIALHNSDYGGMYKGNPLRGRVKAAIDSTMQDGFDEEHRTLTIGEPIVLRGDTFHVADVTMYGDVMILVRGMAKEGSQLPPYKGQLARNFEAVTVMGDSLSLFEFLADEKKYVLLDFWGSWCAPCIDDIPKLDSISTAYKDQLAIVGIALDEEEVLRNAIDQHALTWPQVRQSSMAASIIKDYHISAYPSYFLIGPDSTIAETNSMLRSKDLQYVLGEVLEQ